MSRLKRGQEALIARQRKGAVSGNTITYTRIAGGSPIDLTNKAWTGNTVFRRVGVNDVGAAAVVFGDRDYLIPYVDLGFEPERGDRITETINGTPVVFEVIAPLDEPEWRWNDHERTLMKVHTKEQQ